MDKRLNANERRHDLAVLIDLYLLRCQVEGKSPNTLKAYTETLRRFARIAKEESFPKDVRHITSAHIYTYLGRFTHYTLETRHRYFREVRCFFNWLVNAEYLQKNPFRSLRNLRLPQKIVRPFSAEEITRLLAALTRPTDAAVDRADDTIPSGTRTVNGWVRVGCLHSYEEVPEWERTVVHFHPGRQSGRTVEIQGEKSKT